MRTVKFFALFILLILNFSPSVAQADYTVPLDQITVDALTEGIGPGDVVCLEAGIRHKLLLKNFNGTANNPIIVKNCGGQTVINATQESNGSRPGYGLLVSASNYIRVTGTGDPNHTYGITVNGAASGRDGDGPQWYGY